MTEFFRCDVLGAVKIGRAARAPAIHAAAGCKLVALATSDPARAAPFRALVPGLRVHDSNGAPLANPGIDAVYLPLQNHLRVEGCGRALSAGEPIPCARPIAKIRAILASDEVTP